MNMIKAIIVTKRLRMNTKMQDKIKERNFIYQMANGKKIVFGPTTIKMVALKKLKTFETNRI